MAKPETLVIQVSVPSQARAGLGMRAKLGVMGQGAVGGLVGSVCCALPLAVMALGLTGGLASAAVGLASALQPYSLVLGLSFVGIASWVTLRRSQACCTLEEYRRRRVIVPMTMLASFAIVYVAVMYLLIPLLR